MTLSDFRYYIYIYIYIYENSDKTETVAIPFVKVNSPYFSLHLFFIKNPFLTLALKIVKTFPKTAPKNCLAIVK